MRCYECQTVPVAEYDNYLSVRLFLSVFLFLSVCHYVCLCLSMSVCHSVCLCLDLSFSGCLCRSAFLPVFAGLCLSISFLPAVYVSLSLCYVYLVRTGDFLLKDAINACLLMTRGRSRLLRLAKVTINTVF